MVLYPLGLETVGELGPQGFFLRLDPGFSGKPGSFLLESPGGVHGERGQGQPVDLALANSRAQEPVISQISQTPLSQHT